MFGISATELLVILGIALIIFGPEKLPEIASSIGRLTGTLKKHTNDLRREFYNSVYTPYESTKDTIDSAKRKLRAELTNAVTHDEDASKYSTNKESLATKKESEHE